MTPAHNRPLLFPSTIFVALLLITLAACDRLQSQEQINIQLPPRPVQLQLPQVAPFNISFSEFKKAHGKHYSTVAQQTYRQHIFHANRRMMNRHNANQSRTYNMKPNQFMDVTSLQFKDHYTGTYRSDWHSKNVSDQYLHRRKRNRGRSADRNQTKQYHHHRDIEEKSNSQQNQTKNGNSNISSHEEHRLLQSVSSLSQLNSPSASNVLIDWSIYAGPIKYQGFCGACYAFTAVDTLSIVNAISKYSFYISLSVQQIIDCTNNNLTFGCSGGYLQGAFTYIQLNGITTEQVYPYTSANTGKAGTCQREGGPFKLSSFNQIPEGDCNSVIRSLASGPVSVGIAGYSLQFYDTGVFNDCNSVLDHAVIIVGYKSGVGWRIKNSWGTKWGQEGFGWIAEGNTCGICNMAVSITV